MNSAGVVTSGRVTHESASVDDLAAASPTCQRDGVAGLVALPDVEEAFVLSTCNRVEAYVDTADPAVGEAAIEEFFAGLDDAVVETAGHDDCLRHLLRVAAGLESVVLGEDQIMGQVRTAYEDAREVDAIGGLLETAVTKAIHVGERARTETEINEGIVSLGSAATRLAKADVSLEGATALVVGAGEMGRLAARCLADAGVAEVIVANRTLSHAEHVAAELEPDASAVPLSALGAAGSRADVIVTATGSEEPLLEPAHVGERVQVVVDFGQPRDVCPSTAASTDVTVYDLDDLESLTAETREQRADAAREVEAILDREFEHLCAHYKRTRADEVIASMYESAERIKRRELETAIARLEGEELSPAQRDVVESMADALVGQLLAPPTKSLREAAADDDWSTINTALQLFDPSFRSQAGTRTVADQAPEPLDGFGPGRASATDETAGSEFEAETGPEVQIWDEFETEADPESSSVGPEPHHDASVGITDDD